MHGAVKASPVQQDGQRIHQPGDIKDPVQLVEQLQRLQAVVCIQTHSCRPVFLSAFADSSRSHPQSGFLALLSRFAPPKAKKRKKGAGLLAPDHPRIPWCTFILFIYSTGSARWCAIKYLVFTILHAVFPFFTIPPQYKSAPVSFSDRGAEKNRTDPLVSFIW